MAMSLLSNFYLKKHHCWVQIKKGQTKKAPTPCQTLNKNQSASELQFLILVYTNNWP